MQRAALVLGTFVGMFVAITALMRLYSALGATGIPMPSWEIVGSRPIDRHDDLVDR